MRPSVRGGREAVSTCVPLELCNVLGCLAKLKSGRAMGTCHVYGGSGDPGECGLVRGLTPSFEVSTRCNRKRLSCDDMKVRM